MVHKLLVAAGAIAAFTCSSLFASGADSPPKKDTVVAEVNGAVLTLADLERSRPTALFQARENYYEGQRRALEDYIDEYLLAQEARKENVSVAELLERHVNSMIAKDPSEETLRVYYEGVDTTEPYESVRGKIVDALRQRRMGKAKTAYVQSLRSKAGIVLQLEAPRAPISMKDTPVRGPAGAPITLLEYADYECQYCQQIQPAVERLQDEYKGKLAFAYKDFPLQMHANAQKAAEATRCAEAQGRYWEYHDTLEKTKQLDLPALKDHARTLKLDPTAFDKCLANSEKADAVKAHATEAQTLGLQGTPTFFVNGRFVSGAVTYERIRAVIEEELKAAERQSASSGPARAGGQAR